MWSLLPQCTEQWYAWVFLWGRFKKPSLEAGRCFTISLMLGYNECPCVPQIGGPVCECEFCFCYTDRLLRLASNSIILSFWSVCLYVCCRVSLPERVGWHVSVCPDAVQQPVTASPFSFSLSLSQGCSVVSASSCQWWTTAGQALTLAGIHRTAFLLTETSSTECWVLLSPIVSTLHSSFFSLTYAPNNLSWLSWTLPESMSTHSQNKQEWTLCSAVCKQNEKCTATRKSALSAETWLFPWRALWKC